MGVVSQQCHRVVVASESRGLAIMLLATERLAQWRHADPGNRCCADVAEARTMLWMSL